MCDLLAEWCAKTSLTSFLADGRTERALRVVLGCILPLCVYCGTLDIGLAGLFVDLVLIIYLVLAALAPNWTVGYAVIMLFMLFIIVILGASLASLALYVMSNSDASDGMKQFYCFLTILAGLIFFTSLKAGPLGQKSLKTLLLGVSYITIYVVMCPCCFNCH